MKLFKKSSKGFTLIELLVVIAVLGVLAAAVIAAINPAAKLNLAKDSTVKSHLGQMVNALQAYYTAQPTPVYPLNVGVLGSPGLGALVTASELVNLPNQQAGKIDCIAAPDGLTAGSTYCYVTNVAGSAVAIWGTLFSPAEASIWCWDSKNSVYKTTLVSNLLPTQATPICN